MAKASLHLHAVPDDLGLRGGVEPIFFVIQRANGSWSPGAKIISIHHIESVAEDEAAKMKKLHPQQAFGVAALRSEAREVLVPVEIVRVDTGEHK